MSRTLLGQEISEKDGFYSATDLVRAGNNWRRENGIADFNLSQYLKGNKTKNFISELESRYGECVISSRGRNSDTWVHPLVFIDIATGLNKKLMVEFYPWLYDELIKYRNDPVDLKDEMKSAIFNRYNNIRDFNSFLAEIETKIKKKLNVKYWEDASEEKIKQRDKIYSDITLLCRVLKDTNTIIRIALNG